MQKLLTVSLVTCISLLCGCTGLQRKYLFYPSHHNGANGLTAWQNNGKVIGYSRQVPSPENVWLILHGNAGQAADRTYALPSFSTRDSVFILEYPGYGTRDGKPSRAAFDTAAQDAYAILRRTFPNLPICVMGESIGSGPASMLATLSPPPDKIVLVVPFNKLTSVASHHIPFLPMSLLLEAKWDNHGPSPITVALSKYLQPSKTPSSQLTTPGNSPTAFLQFASIQSPAATMTGPKPAESL